MKLHLELLRFYVAETLLYWAWALLPNGREKREMAIFLQHSWIARLVNGDDDTRAMLERTKLQDMWRRKLADK